MFKNVFNKVKLFFSESDTEKKKELKKNINQKYSDQELKDIFKPNTKLSNKVVLYFDSLFPYQAFQVAKSCKLKKIIFYKFIEKNENIQQYSDASNIDIDFSDQIEDDALIAIDHLNHVQLEGFDTVYYVLSTEQLKQFNDKNIFIQPNIENINDIAMQLSEQQYNIIGISTSCSIFEYKNINSLLKIFHTVHTDKYKINEMDLLAKMKSGLMNFYDIRYMLEKTKEIAKSSLSSIMGIKWTPELDLSIKRNITIVNAMTHKERLEQIKLDSSRIDRIAKGSASTIQQVEMLVKMLEMFRQNSGQLSQNAGNPTELMKILGGMKVH